MVRRQSRQDNIAVDTLQTVSYNAEPLDREPGKQAAGWRHLPGLT
jgi:hypothetical protein